MSYPIHKAGELIKKLSLRIGRCQPTNHHAFSRDLAGERGSYGFPKAKRVEILGTPYTNIVVPFYWRCRPQQTEDTPNQWWKYSTLASLSLPAPLDKYCTVHGRKAWSILFIIYFAHTRLPFIGFSKNFFLKDGYHTK